MAGTETSPTRSAFLELQDERQVVREGFEFLDEKRVILAQEMLRRLEAFQGDRDRYQALHAEAVVAMARALGRHGLDGLEVHPPWALKAAELDLLEQPFLGVSLVDADLVLEQGSAEPAVNPSPESRRCAAAFIELTRLALAMAVQRSCLERLIDEYIRTERRARALENVVLPEITESLEFINEQLEAVDQEEAIRVRTARKTD
ncbi:MAG: V-type ATP synthase subunit D [Wenzhouxiangella sp.]|jgi:V/A-type H+-transporting ATPase subunit D|nr:V-type ATP synthase subunit D [Wenzhouxiangella sp.]